jgi:hypothetical protein
MGLTCRVMVSSGEEADCTFLTLPRIGEDVFIWINGHTDSFKVERVAHFARDATPDAPEPFLLLHVRR